jgi:hypothetical protein
MFIVATTIYLTKELHVELPKQFCEQAHIEPGTSLRVTQIGNGLYITPIPEPTEEEFQAVVKASGGPISQMTKENLESVLNATKAVRKRKRNARRS